MRKLKRLAWFCFVAGCCAALVSMDGERSPRAKVDASETIAYLSVTYCPTYFYGEYCGIYAYGAFLQGADCATAQIYNITDYRLHQLGTCPDCPDPIFTTGHPARIDPQEHAPVPQPDPMFGGIVR